MTALTDDIRAALEADTGAGGVATLLAGGIYDVAEAGRIGLSRDNTATSGAYDANGKLRPCVFIRSRSEVPDLVVDDPAPATSVRETVELWFYQDDGFGTIEAAETRAFRILHRVRLPATRHTVYYMGTALRVYDEIYNAFTLRAVYGSGYVKQ